MIQKIRLVFMCLILLVLCNYCTGQDSLSKYINGLLDRWDNSNSPGCAVAIVKDGTVIYKHGYGMANLEYDVPITSSSVFHVASISKQFTAFSVLLLEDEGKLSLDDDIRLYLPELPDYGKKITIRHLIHHTSGIKDQWELLIAAGWRMDDVITQKHLLKVIKSQKDLNFNPGEKYLYSNSGYTLLAEIVEQVSGLPFTQFTRERIFDPLEMKNTHFHADNESLVKMRTYPFRPAGKNFSKHDRLNFSTVGATSLFTSAEDFVKWDQNFYHAKVGGKNIIDKMHKTFTLNNGQKTNYACGLIIRNYKGEKAVSHTGGDAGYRGIYLRFPDHTFSIILFSNLGSFDLSLAYKIADKYLHLSSGQSPMENEAQLLADTLSPSQLTKYTGMYANQNRYIYEVVLENGKLLLQFLNNYQVDLDYISDHTFYSEHLDIQLHFKADSTGSISQFTVRNKGIFNKIEPEKIPEEQIEHYTGHYYNKELNVIKTVTKKNELIYITGKNETENPLIKIDEDSFYKTCSDEFSAKLSLVKFLSNENGTITGYVLNTPMAKNLVFKKISNIKYEK